MVDRKTAIKIANWYYIDGMTQDEIAKKLGYSRQRVNKIIKSLVPEGVVTIVVNGLDSENIMLENILENHFSLNQVIVADTTQGELPLLSELGKKAARFLDDFIQDGKTIGVSWGNTLGETIRSMRSVHKVNCSVVQLVGGLNTSDQAVKPDEIARMLARKLYCDYSILYAPAIMNSEIARDIMAQQDFFKESIERINSCDIAVVGVGQLDKSATIVTHGYLQETDLNDMINQGYVGDLCFNHYRADGDVGSFKLQNRVMGVDLAALNKIPVVVAIAGGEDKAEAVLGALNTGCVDVLITDTTLAQRLEEIIANKSKDEI